MNCDSCIKLNPLPACISTETFILSGLTFPNHMSEFINVKFTDTATGRTNYFIILIDGTGEIVGGGMDVADYMPLMNHWYTLHFSIDGSPADFLLTNPDNTEATGCCLEFTVYDGLLGADGWELTSQECAV
jgi:hypothetical protein